MISWKQRSHSAYDSVAYVALTNENQIVAVGSRRGKTKPITKRVNLHCVCWFILPLLLPTPLIWFSLVHKRNVSDGVVNGIGRNGNIPSRQRSSDSDSVALMTPLTIPIFDLLKLKVISSLPTLLTTPTPTPTPSQVKTSLSIHLNLDLANLYITKPSV